MKYPLIVLAAILFTACTSAPKEFKPEQGSDSAASIEAKQLAAQMEANEVTEIEFIPETSDLTTLSKRLLKRSMERALVRGPLERIAVVAWADEEYPSVHEPKLSKEQRQLADSRTYVIKRFLRQYDEQPVIRVYSMAERSGTLDSLLGNREWKIKKVLEESGVPNTDTSVKLPSKTAKAIVLFKNVPTEKQKKSD